MSLYEAYATTAQLATYLGVEEEALPANSERLLLRASELVAQATLGRIDLTDEDLEEAAQLATCAQVEYWQDGLGEGADISGRPNNFSLGDLSMNYGKGYQAKGALCDRSRRYLSDQCLLYRGISATGRSTEECC
jgi:hypothetical protein